MSPNKDSWNW